MKTIVTRGLILLGLVISLAVIQLKISGKEQVIREGRTVLLKLAPVDPRSLMQGDYMVLRYALGRDKEFSSAVREKQEMGVREGRVVLTVGDDNVGTFARFEDGTLSEEETLLLWRSKKRGVFLAPESFLFEEGMGKHFQQAKYGELRVHADGTCVLVGLRDEGMNVL